MAEDVLVTYKVGESIYQIPASNQQKLLEKYPDAERMSTFNYGGEDYYIPNQNAEKFISKYPDAEPMDNDANIFMQSYRGKQNRGIPTITVTEGEENGLTSTLAESEDVSQKPKASNGDIATPQPVNDTFFKEDAATQQQNIAKDKKDRAIAEQIYNTFESKPELFKTVEAREKFYDLLASKGYANAFSIGESMVSGDSRFDQRDEKPFYDITEELEGAINAFKRGMARYVDIPLGSDPKSAKEIIRSVSKAESIKPTAAFQKFSEAQGALEKAKIWAKDPFEISSQLMLESGATLLRTYMNRQQAAETAALTLGGGVVGGPAGLGAGFLAANVLAGLKQEYAAAYLEAMRDAGVDLTDEKSIEAFLKNDEQKQAARNFAYKRGVPIAMLNLVGAKISGGIVAAPTKTVAGKVAKGTAGMGVEVASEAAGEASAQLASKGELDTGEIFTEAIAGVPSSVVEVTASALAQSKDLRKGSNYSKIKQTQQQFNDVVDLEEGLGTITEEEGNKMKAEFAAAKKADEKIPADTPNRETVIDAETEVTVLTDQLKEAGEVQKPFIEAQINEVKKKVAIPLPPKYVNSAGKNTNELIDGQQYITRKGNVEVWDATTETFIEPPKQVEVEAGTEVELEPTQPEVVRESQTEQKTEQPDGTDAKKADIERRRQENPSVERGVLINFESGKTKEQLIDIVNKLKNGEINLSEIIKEFSNLPVNTLSEVKKAFNDGTLADKIQFGLDTKELSDLQPKTISRESIINAKQKAIFQKQKTEAALKDSEYKTVKKTDPITGKVTETKVKRTAEEKTKYEDFHKKALEDVNKEIEKYDAELKALEEQQSTSTAQTATAQSGVEAKKADIEIGKVGNTEYEVKSDGVYYQGKKLDNPGNKTHRQLIEADIERRRQEELLGETFTKTTEKIVTSKGSSNGKTIIRKVKSKISSDGEVLTITPTAEFKEGGGVTTTPETMTLKEFKEQFYEKMSEEDKDFFDEIFEVVEDTERIKLKEARIGLKGVYKGHVNIDVETLEGQPFGFRINNDKEINAKYDAELAALEQPEIPTAPAVETPAETVSETVVEPPAVEQPAADVGGVTTPVVSLTETTEVLATSPENVALKDVESKAKALEGVAKEDVEIRNVVDRFEKKYNELGNTKEFEKWLMGEDGYGGFLAEGNNREVFNKIPEKWQEQMWEGDFAAVKKRYSKAVEELLGAKPQPEPTVEAVETSTETVAETVVQEPPAVEQPAADVGGEAEVAPDVSQALKDVESTAKALGGVDEKELNKIPDWVSKKVQETKTKKITLKNGQDVTLKYLYDNEPNNKVAYILGFNEKGNQISTVMIEVGKDGKWRGNDLEVNKEYRRKGLASAMYDYADEQGHNLTPTKSLRPDGVKFWQNRNKKRAEFISEAYHKAKADGSNPELVKAVEQLLGKPTEAPKAEAPKTETIDALKDVESTAKALEGVGKEKGKNVFEIGKKIYDTIFSDLDTKENEIRAFLNIDEKQRDKQLQLEKGKLDKLQRQYDRKQLITENDINALEKQKEKVELIDGLLKSQKVSISDIDNQLAKYALDKYPNIFIKKETYPFYAAKGYDNVKNELISEAYHKAKQDDSNTELVKAVEELLTPKENAIQEQEASGLPIQPKAKDSSGDIGSSTNVGGAKESDITAGTNKTQPSKNVGLQTQDELVETPALKDVESTAKALENKDISEIDKKIEKVYHGTSYNIQKPTIEKYGQVHTMGGMLGKAVYYTPSIDEAKYFADLSLNKNKGGIKKVIEGVLNAKNIVSVTDLIKNVKDNVLQKWIDDSGKKYVTVKDVKERINIESNEKSLTSWLSYINDISVLAKMNGNDAVTWGYENGKPNEIAIIDDNLVETNKAKYISEAYHKAKADGSNPELVQAVEELLGKKQPSPITMGQTQTTESATVLEPLKDVESTAKALENINPEISNEKKLVETKYGIIKKGNEWKVKGAKSDTIINIDDADLIDELNENKILLNKNKEQINRLNNYWEKEIIPKYGDKEYNRSSEKAYEASQQKTALNKSRDKLLITNNYLQERISEAYHKAKADGSNPELVKAVEQLLGKPTEAPKAEAPKTETIDALKDVESTAKALEGEITFEGKRGQADSITYNGGTIKKGEEIELDNVNISQDDSMPDFRSGKYKVRMLSVDANGKKATLTLTDGNEVITTTVKDLRKAQAEAYHKAKADGSNPELVKAVEQLLGKPTEAPKAEAPKTETIDALKDVESTAKALEGADVVINTPIKGLAVRMQDLKIAEENLAKGKKSVTPNAPVDVTINLTTGKRELSDGYHRYLDARGGTIEAAKTTNLDGTIPAKINFEINEKSGGFIKTRKATNQEISEAYHKAKQDGSNPELVKAVEELIGKPKEAKSEQKQEKPAIEKTLVEEHGVAKEDAAIVTSVLDKLNKGLQSMGVSFDITKGLQLGKGKEGSEASAHAQFRIDKGKRIVEILKSDLPAKEKATAVLHEVGHLSLHELLQQHIDGSTPEIKKALDTMIKAFNESGRSGEAKKRLGGDVTIEKLIEEHNAFKEQGEKINAASTEALSDNIPNFRDFHEFITDSLNKYLKDGTAGFGKEFDAVLQKIKELLVHVYDTVRGGTLEGLTVSPELKQVFDRMLGKDVDLFKEPEKPQAKPLGEVKVDMPTTDEQGRVMSLSEALRMAKEQGQIKGKETGGLKHSEGMSEADFVAMYQKQQQDNLRAELLGAEDVDVAHTAGEERISQRQRKWKAVTVKEAKKIIEGLDPKYESTNAESVNSLVDRIFAPFQDYIKAGVDVFDVASEYAKSIYPKDRTEPYAAHKAAVATVLMTKAANELRMGFRFADSAAAGSERGVFKRGTLEYDIAAESLKKFEDYLSGDKRVDATALAFANSHINPNEVYALLDAIDNSRKKVMGEKAKSGRTKEEVAKEMRTLKPTAEEVDTAAEKATAKTTKVKPKRSLFSGSTTKKTRSTISVERKKSAKDKLKSGLSKIQAAIPSAKPTPKKGGLTEEPPLPKGVVEGVKDIAEAAISEGHYTQEAIKDYVAEKTKGILDRATSDGIIDKAWDGEIKQKSGAARADEVSYAIVKALKTGKGDAITKQLGEALLMQDAEYDPSSKTKRQQATARLAEILKDPAAAEARLNAAINMVVNQSIVNPKMLDYLGLDPVDFLASKENPHGMTMEQFEAFSRDMLKKKLYDMAQDFMGHGVHEQRVLPLPKKRIKPSASEVKKFIKDFYDNPEMTDSMLETALTDHFDITPEQATAIASKVRGELADIVASRSQKKIDALAEEISDGDRTKKKRVTDMVVKALTTNGAFGDIPFSEKMAAALSNRSVAPADINKILAYGRMANATDSSLLKAFYMRKAATILSKYDMSAASFLFQGLYEQGVVNILGNPRTSILTASLSMLKTMPFDVVRMFVIRPSTFVRAVRFSKLIGSKGIGSVTGEGFRAILNGVETVRNRAEIETKPQIRRESANKQARLTSWRYLRKASLSGNDPKRAQLIILKALQSLTLSGGSLRQNIGGKTYEFSPTHWLVNLISGLDVVVKAGLMNLHNYYNAERFIRESGIKFGTSEFTKKMSEMLTTDPLIFDAIDKQVNMEVADAMKNGIPLPKDYVHERKTQLYQEYVDKDVVSQSLFEINKSALIGIPRTWLGAHTYNFIRSNTEIKDNEKTVNAAVKYFFGSALYFSRVGINVIERRGRGIPFYNMFLAAAPYEFTIDASGKVVRRTTESGKVIRRVDNKRDFAFGILQATTTTALAVMLINNIFQQEDLKDEKGNPVIDPATGEPVKHWVLNPSFPIRFHGRKKALTTTEKNAVPAMCIELTNVEDPDKRFWKFEWFPESWYPMLFMLGEESDDIRYKEEKLQVGGTEKDNSMLRSVQEEPTSMFRIVTTAGIGAFNASFTTPAQTADEASRLISQDKKRDAAATIAYRLIGQPFITTVNPRLAGQIADAYDYFKEREKTYVKLSIENTNIRSAVSNMAQYSMNQVWAGRYLVNNEDNKYTIYDAHGQPMEREPGDLLFLPAMFSEDMYYGWAEHIYKSPLYKIYMDDNGNFDESVIAIPNRIGWNDKVSVSDMVKQQVRQKTREYYGQLVTKFYGKLLSTPYEERGEFIKELWKAAVNEAKTEYGAKEKTVEGAVGVMQRKNMTDGNAKEE